MVMTFDRKIEMIEDLDVRVKNIESSIRIISNEIRNATKRISKIEKLLIAGDHGISPFIEMKFDEWIRKIEKKLEKKIGEIDSAMKEFDLRIDHFESYFRRS